MSRKNPKPHKTEVPSAEIACLVWRADDRGALKIRVAIKSESIQVVGNLALKEAPSLLVLARTLARKMQYLLAGQWKSDVIVGSDNCYVFDITPACPDAVTIDLDQIVRDCQRVLSKALQSLQEHAKQGKVAPLRKLNISKPEFEVLRCLRAIEAEGGKVHMAVMGMLRQQPAGTQRPDSLDASQANDCSWPPLEASTVQIPLDAPTHEAFLAVAKEDRHAARVAGRVVGIMDLPDARVAITVGGGKPMPTAQLDRDVAIELFRDGVEVQGVLAPMGMEMVLTDLTWQARLDLEPVNE